MPTKLPHIPYGQPRGAYHHGLVAVPDCGGCPLYNETRVEPDGPIPARIAFVGEEPGITERMHGRGFVGQSGRLLWRMAKEAGIEREDVWVTNAALCSAKKVVLSSGAIIPVQTVKAMAARQCRARLVQELRTVNPAVIVPLGNWALWAIADIPKSKIYGYRGSRLEVDLDDLLHRIVSGTANEPMRQIKAM